MNILITGGLGLIGYQLAMKLSKNYEITIIDKKDSKAYDLENVTFIKTDICKLDDYTLNGYYDGLIHLAAVSRVITGEQKPLLTWETNVNATNKLFQRFFKKNPQSWLIYGSSREVYGENPNLPISEECPLSPINRYGLSKFSAEAIVKAFAKKGHSSLIFRFSNVYGSLNDHPDRVIPTFIQKALKNETLYLHGGDSTFDFTHLKDTITGIILGIKYLQEGNLKNASIFNLTTNHGSTLKFLAETIIDLTCSSSRYIETNVRTFDVKHFVGSYEKASNLLGYEPKLNLVTGLKELIEEAKINLLLEGTK